ncbi:aldehyde dehydrogenase family protein, partial [Enterococcus faecium]
MTSYQTLNPFDGRVLRTVELMSAVAVEQRLAAAQAAFPAWSGLPLAQRG